MGVRQGVLSLRNNSTLPATLNVNATTGAAIEFQGGANVLSNGTINLIAGGSGISGNGQLRNISGNNFYNGTVNLSSGVGTIGSDAGTLTIGGKLTGGSADNALVKVGAGTIALTNDASTFVGQFRITAGTLSFTSITNGGGTLASSLGFGEFSTNNVILLGNATMKYVGTAAAGHSSDRPVVLNGAGTIDASGVGTLNLNGATPVSGAGQNLTLAGTGSGVLAGVVSNTTGTLTKNDSGTWTLAGTTSNNLTGTTTVNGGTLLLNKTAGANAFAGNLVVGDGVGGANADVVRLLADRQMPSSATVTILNSGRYDLNGFSQTNASLAMTGGSVTTGAGTLILGGNVTGNADATTATVSGNLNLGGATRTFTIADGAAARDMSASAVISNGGLSKQGAGTLELSAANTYAGNTTVSGGTLLVNNGSGSGTGSGSVTVNGGGTLGGTGAISGAVTVMGNLSPGNSPGKLTLGNGLDMSVHGTNVWELGALTTSGPGVNFDFVSITNGNLVLGGTSVLSLNFISPATDPDQGDPFWASNPTWKIIDVSGTASNPGNSIFPTILNGTYTAGSFTDFAGTGADAGDIFLQFNSAAVPEPGTVWLMLAAGGLIAVRIRRRDRS
jgi:autotransporter-associated beta strand protein